jgi:predicted DNA-binding protein
MPIRPFRTPLRGTITVRVDDDLLQKIDELATESNRTRADMLRQLIVNARMTGLPDVAVDLPVEATST